MNLRRTIRTAISAVVLVLGAQRSTANDEASGFAATDAQILDEIRDHCEVMQNLEYLSDNIGARLTGSSQLKHANDWTAETFRKYGLSNVHLEPWTIAHSWTRGTAIARMISPAEHPLTIASAGWSPSTAGLVRGRAIFVDAKKKEDLEKYKGKLKGAIVIYQEPASLSPPKPENRDAELLRPMQAPPVRVGEPAAPSPFAALREFAQARREFFKQEGTAAVLLDSNKPHGLLNMTGIGGERFDIGAVPTAFATGESYRLLYRMMKNAPVTVEIQMTNVLSDKPVEVYNTVAEIRGAEKPDEVVILGAHLDSWDLGTGATDNGTGSMTVLEAARALAKLNLKPKRTIRFVLFTGEEEGLVGSKMYVQAHKSELDKISGVLVHDTGTGRVLTLGLHDNYQDREIVDQVLAPLWPLKLLEPSMLRQFGTDHASFDDAGVPGFWVIQDGAEYNQTHHSQSDTFDKAWKDDLVQGAQVLAAWAYNTAQLPSMLPRRPLPPKTESSATKDAAPDVDPITAMDAKILEQVKADQDDLKSSLTYLTETIGPRLTGSTQLDQASHWTLDQFKQIGLSAPHLEPWSIATTWKRGPATGRIVSPVDQTLTLAALGWTPGTNKTLRAEIIAVTVDKLEDLADYKGKLAGKIVLFGRARELQVPENPTLVPWATTTIPINLPKSDKPIDWDSFVKTRIAALKFFQDEKAAAVLVTSEKMYGLLNMGTFAQKYQVGTMPAAYVEREQYQKLWRLVEKGKVEAELNIQASVSEKPAEVYNTVAEILGTEKTQEVVIIGAHLDSWDLGTGATDNGTGSMAVLEAARALQKLGVKPKRTIRFILFTGEEQGLNGSKAYVAAHKNDLENISGVLIHDTGTGKVLSVGLMGNYAVRETMDRVLYPLARPLGIMEPTLRKQGGSDHVPFDEAGVPAFWCVQDPADYAMTHHSQADTLERVRWDDLTEGAQLLAVWAYNVAELPEKLERKEIKPVK